MAKRRVEVETVVIENRSLCREHFSLTLRAAQGFPPTLPGQFVQIACRSLDEELSDGGAFLRRPFSLAGRRDLEDGSTDLQIIHRVVGAGTAWLAERRVGDRVNVLGPLGNAFALPPAGARAILVAGGVGIPPMLYLAERLARAKIETTAFVGATTKDLLPLTPRIGNQTCAVEEFATLGVASIVSTDDGSLGEAGFVTAALQRWLETEGAQSGAIVYTCGPELMMKRVAEIGAAFSLPVQIAVERPMACGLGTCQSCCIRVAVPPSVDPAGWRYKLACTDGPIFQSSELLW